MAGTRQVFAALLLALLVVGTALTASAPAATNHGDGGEIHRAAEPIAGQYVVTLQGVAPSHVPATAAGLARANGGTVLMIHAKADDYKTDPAGNAGDRIACGTITK